MAPNVAGLPKGTWVSTVEAGRFDEGAAFATFDGHQNGDMKTLRLPDGRLRQDLDAAGDDALSGYAHVVGRTW